MKEIMEILSKNGYESYIVGGYVRDYLLGISSHDIDICTNAPINEIIKMFDSKGKAFPQYFSYHISTGDYEYVITTFRRELKYKKNKPIEIEVASSLREDLQRRDFTINTFAMDKNGLFIDLLDSKKDLDDKIIRCVGDTKKRLEEDKTRILRAIRLSCTLDFDLSNEIVDFLSENAKLLNEVSMEYKRKELDKIFDGVGIDKFFYYIRRFDIQKYFSVNCNKILPTFNKYGVWAQIETKLPFSNHELRIIKSIREIVNRGNIKLYDIKSYSEEIVLNAAFILNQVERYKVLKEIDKLHSFIDLDVDIEIFFKYININDIVKVYRLIEKSIVEGELTNNRLDIEDFLENY